jgi:hypothetical protein
MSRVADSLAISAETSSSRSSSRWSFANMDAFMG